MTSIERSLRCVPVRAGLVLALAVCGLSSSRARAQTPQPVPVLTGAPVIVQDANLRAAVGQPYVYNGRQAVTLSSGALPVTFERCDGAPAGFGVDPSSGTVRWTPDTAGAAAACVRVTNALGASEYRFSVDVVERLPTPVTARLTASAQQGRAPLQVAFDSAGSQADPSALALSPLWSFGDGSVPVWGPQQTHTYAMPGTYVAWLRVTDAFGASALASHAVEVLDREGRRPPVARIVASELRGRDSLEVRFGCDCQAGDSPLAAWQWDFGNGTQGDGREGKATYGPGRHFARLTVVDAAGLSSSARVEVVVSGGEREPPGCLAAVRRAAGPALLDVTWQAWTSVAPGSRIASAGWTFDGGETVEGLSAARTYGAPGWYRGTFRVTDDAGLSCEDSVQVTVQGPGGEVPVAIASQPERSARCGVPYAYSPTKRAAAVGSGPLRWSAPGSPEGFTLDGESGEVAWTPMPWQAGEVAVALRVEGALGAGQQDFTVAVSCPDELRFGTGCSTPAGGLSGAVLVALAWLARRRTR